MHYGWLCIAILFPFKLLNSLQMCCLPCLQHRCVELYLLTIEQQIILQTFIITIYHLHESINVVVGECHSVYCVF